MWLSDDTCRWLRAERKLASEPRGGCPRVGNSSGLEFLHEVLHVVWDSRAIRRASSLVGLPIRLDG